MVRRATLAFAEERESGHGTDHVLLVATLLEPMGNRGRRRKSRGKPGFVPVRLATGLEEQLIAVDNDYVHIVWADGRAGFLGSWYARVPLTSYI